MEIISTLKKYGFNDHEAKVYLCLLKHVEISAFYVAKETGLPRTSVYHILESLRNQGLVSSWKKNNVAYFTAESPNRLVKILDDKREMIKEILPDIFNIKRSGDLTPMAKIYQGAEGMKIVWEDILETLEKKGIKELHAVSHHTIADYLPKYFPEWLKRREKQAIFVYLITTQSDQLNNPMMKSNQFREVRLLPASSPVTGTIDIYDNKIAFFTLRKNEIYSVILESETIAEMLRQFFMSTWQLLEPTKGV